MKNIFVPTGSFAQSIAMLTSELFRDRAIERRKREFAGVKCHDSCPCGATHYAFIRKTRSFEVRPNKFRKCCGKPLPYSGVTTFPNDNGGYVRIERQAKPIVLLTTEQRFERLKDAFENPKNLQMRDPGRRVKHRVRGPRWQRPACRRPLAAK